MDLVDPWIDHVDLINGRDLMGGSQIVNLSVYGDKAWSSRVSALDIES